jgi:choline-sulfatase
MRWVWLCALPCVLAACTEDGTRGQAEHGGAAPTVANATPTPTPTPTPNPTPTPTPTPHANGETLTYFDLAAAPERAELREGSALVLDFGERSGAKYSFGGWLSGTGRNQRIEGSRALLVTDKVARLALPADGPNAAMLVLRARGFASGPLTVYVNGEAAAELKLTAKGFQLFQVQVRAGLLHAGDNLLQLRVARTASALGLPSSGLALDWLRVLEPGAPVEDRSPPELAELQDGEAHSGRLRVPAGDNLGFGLEVPAGAELRASVHATQPAKLGVWAVRDNKPPLLLAELDAKPQASALQVDLAPIAGDVARLELRAARGDVVLEQPQIVRPRGPAAPSASAADARKPAMRNAIVVLVDTLRADKLSAYSQKTRVRTPGLDAFAKGAAVMENARSQENWTKPSVATLLSSLLPWQHNTVSGEAKLPESVEILPEILQKRGFYTGAFIANGYCSEKFGFNQGWRTYRNYIHEGRPSRAQFVAGDVLEWLDKRPKDQPFFLYVHTIDPHEPYIPPSSFEKTYDPAEYLGPIDFHASGDVLERIKIGRIKPSDRDKEHLEALYNAEIGYHDVHFAAMMQGLQQRGLADDTMVVVTADHGEEFWDHGSVGHGHSVYDELLHVPLMVRVPGITERAPRVPDAVGLVDVMPTILDALGQPIPDEVVGHSFLPAIRGQDASAPRAAVSGFFRAWRTLAIGRLKLVQHGTERASLYDVQADPGETRDLGPEQPLALGYARGLLGLTLAEDAGDSDVARAQRNHAAESTVIDPKTDAELRALGYVGSSRPK